MKKKMIINNGSCRDGGNTDMLVSMLEKGVKKRQINLNKHILRKKSINNCNGCYHCFKNTRCLIRDDMQVIYEEIQKF